MMQPGAIASLPMETQVKLRRASWVQFAASMLQLACSVAIIVMVRYSLEGATVSIFNIGGQAVGSPKYQCLMSAESEGACQYAYSVASISILVGFVMSLMQCLTMDCCGMGRLMETLVDAGLASWWLAAGVTLGSRAARANAVGIAKAGHRNAVVALCWVSLALFVVLFLVNGYLTLKLGWRMRRLAAPGGQQAGGMGGIQMGGIPVAGPYAGGGYPAAAGGYPGQPGPYGGAAWGAPQGVPAYGYPAGPPGAPPPGGMWGGPPPPPYAGGPPFMQAVVGAPHPAAGAAGAGPGPAGAAPDGGAAAAAAGPSSGFGAAAPGAAQQQPQSPGKGPLAGNPANYLPGAGR